jgi:hypothetical protein
LHFAFQSKTNTSFRSIAACHESIG